MKEDIKHIIEGLLFVAEGPLSPGRMAEILELENTAAVREALNQLGDEYERRRGGFYLAAVAGGYQLRTRPEWREWIQRMLQSGPARLSRAAMETLAIIAYKQPVLKSDVEHIRGVDCGGVLRALLERKLIKILGRKEMPGRPLLYGTTRKFLEIFNLKDLKDLPTPKEIAPETSGTEAPHEQPGLQFPGALEGGADAPAEAPTPAYLPMIIENAPPDPDAKSDPDAESDPAPEAAPGNDPDPPEEDDPDAPEAPSPGDAPEKNT